MSLNVRKIGIKAYSARPLRRLIWYIRNVLRRIGPLRRLISKGYYLLWQARILRRAQEAGTVYDVFRTYWIEPQRIKESIVPAHLKTGQNSRSKSREEYGLIIGGDWDLETVPFESLDVFRAFEQHFVEGRDWRQTDYYRRVADGINAGNPRWGCSTLASFHERLKCLDDLYEDIKEHGYRSQPEMGVCGRRGEQDEILVHIGRNGDYIFATGRHRLSLANLIGIEKVPVKLGRRHSDWVKFRGEIMAYARENGGKVYHPIAHPDLQDIPFRHGTRRLDLMARHAPPGGGGRLLEIGAHWGFFSIAFEKMGFNCTAVENLPRNAYILRKLRRAENCRFKIIQSSIFDAKIEKVYDVVLALNIFHHFLKDKWSYEKLVRLLERLEIKVMFFQPHLEGDRQMNSAYRRYSEEEFVEFIKEKAHLSKSLFLGRDTDGQAIYKIEK